MLTPAAARGKRLAEAIVMKILRVARAVGASTKVLMEYDLNGVKKQYTDTFLSGTPLSDRYIAVASQAVPMNCERFMAAWSFEDPAPYLPLCERERALEEVMPPFQPQASVEPPLSIDQPDARRTAAAVLACGI